MGHFTPLKEPLHVRVDDDVIIVNTPETAAVAARRAALDETLDIPWASIEMQLLKAVEAADPVAVVMAMMRFAEAARASGRVVYAHHPAAPA